MELMQQHQFAVGCEHDVVWFKTSQGTVRFGYNTSFAIAKGLRMASAVVMRLGRVPLAERQIVKRTIPQDAMAELQRSKLSPIERQSNSPTSGLPWSVGITDDGGLVTLEFGNVLWKFEAENAATLAGWFRARALEAKRWAGDTGTTRRLSGILTDANDNERRGAN